MNRPLKFRAWYASGLGKMVYFGEPIVSNTELERGDTWGMFFPIVQGKAYIAGSIPMQFTGLLDKTGKEIYEGDIVECEFGDGGTNYAKIVFNDGCFDVVFFLASNIRRYVKEFSGNHAIKVVGNIYENPELLK